MLLGFCPARCPIRSRSSKRTEASLSMWVPSTHLRLTTDARMLLLIYIMCRCPSSMFYLSTPRSLGMPKQVSIQDGTGEGGQPGKQADTKSVLLISSTPSAPPPHPRPGHTHEASSTAVRKSAVPSTYSPEPLSTSQLGGSCPGDPVL